MKNVLLIFVLLFFVSCSRLFFAPGITTENLGHQKIKNIDGKVGKIRFSRGLGNLNVGQGGTEIYYIKDKNDIFGPVHIEWENESGKKFSKDFTIDKSQIPYDRKFRYRWKDIIFFFYDDDVEMHIVQSWPDQYVIQKREARKAEAIAKSKEEESKNKNNKNSKNYKKPTKTP